VLRNLAPAALSPAAADGSPGFFYVPSRPPGGDLEHRYVLGVRSEPSPRRARAERSAVPRHPDRSGIYSGYLGAGDVDFFRCELPAGAEIAVQVAPSRKTDLVLELLLPGSARPQRAMPPAAASPSG
jgi:hypothetical protein